MNEEMKECICNLDTKQSLDYLYNCALENTNYAIIGKKFCFENITNYIVKLEQENTILQQQLKDKDEKISRVIEYCNEKLKWNRDDGNDYWAGKNNAQQQVSSDIKDILETNKED